MQKVGRRVLLGMGAGATAYVAHHLWNQKAESSNAQQRQAGGVINVYSARHYDTDKALYNGFTEQTGIRVNLIEAEADALIERIRSEGSRSPADVLITVDAGRLWRAQQAVFCSRFSQGYSTAWCQPTCGNPKVTGLASRGAYAF